MHSQETKDVLAEFRSDLARLQNDVDKLTRSTNALVEAWNTATGVVKFVKFLSTLATAIAVCYAFVSHGFGLFKS